MMANGKRIVGLTVLILAYPLMHYIVQYIPNPFVPHANLAINMIFPILAGYFFGPISGAVAGALGTGVSALLAPDIYDALAILPHMTMGLLAGIAGNSQAQFPSALCIAVGHILNILFFWRFGFLEYTGWYTLALGLVTESTIDVVAIILIIVFFQRLLYETEQRW
jgi:uncharacterized membrane protein